MDLPNVGAIGAVLECTNQDAVVVDRYGMAETVFAVRGGVIERLKQIASRGIK